MVRASRPHGYGLRAPSVTAPGGRGRRAAGRRRRTAAGGTSTRTAWQRACTRRAASHPTVVAAQPHLAEVDVEHDEIARRHVGRVALPLLRTVLVVVVEEAARRRADERPGRPRAGRRRRRGERDPAHVGLVAGLLRPDVGVELLVDGAGVQADRGARLAVGVALVRAAAEPRDGSNARGSTNRMPNRGSSGRPSAPGVNEHVDEHMPRRALCSAWCSGEAPTGIAALDIDAHLGRTDPRCRRTRLTPRSRPGFPPDRRARRHAVAVVVVGRRAPEVGDAGRARSARRRGTATTGWCPRAVEDERERPRPRPSRRRPTRSPSSGGSAVQSSGRRRRRDRQRELVEGHLVTLAARARSAAAAWNVSVRKYSTPGVGRDLRHGDRDVLSTCAPAWSGAAACRRRHLRRPPSTRHAMSTAGERQRSRACCGPRSRRRPGRRLAATFW